MANKNKISIIIVNFNSYRYLNACLASIQTSNISKDQIEVIVVDNASSEISNIKYQISNINIIRNKENVGFAKANNQALKNANGKYVLFLNPDTVVGKETLKTMLDFMEDNPSVGVATCRVELPSGELDDACHRGFPTPWNALCYFTGIGRIFPNSLIFNGYHLGYRKLNKIHEIDSCVGAFMMVRKTFGDSVGWLDEAYFWYGEDLDFCYRIKQKGWKVMFVPSTTILHHKGTSSGIKKHSKHLSSADFETRLLATRARFDVMRIFYRKHYIGKYPRWLTGLVMIGITLKEKLIMMQIQREALR